MVPLLTEASLCVTTLARQLLYITQTPTRQLLCTVFQQLALKGIEAM